jgi:signal transduction histidine kinase
MPLRKAFLGTVASSAAVLLLSATAPTGLAGDRQLEVLLHVGAAFAALAAAQLFVPRFLEGRATSQAALGLSCASLAIAGFAAALLVSSGSGAAGVTWASGTLAAAAYMAWSALGPATVVSPRALTGLVGVALAATGVGLLGLAEAASAPLFFVAALVFAARARGGIDLVAAGISGAAILAFYESLDRLLLSKSGSAASAALELACSSFLLAAATLEARLLWERRASEKARAHAAEVLHGGLAQELALLVMVGKQQLARARDDGALRELLRSSERALDEARHAIASLRRPADAPLAVALAQEGQEVASRLGLQLDLELGEVEASEDVTETLTHILRESLALAASEYGCNVAVAALAEENGTVLRVHHGGTGPRHEDASELRSIERRAQAAGGALRLVSGPDGRLIEVTIP